MSPAPNASCPPSASHEINHGFNDHFGSKVSEHFDWCDVFEITESIELECQATLWWHTTSGASHKNNRQEVSSYIPWRFQVIQICERCHDMSRLGSRNLKRICQNLRLSVPMNHRTTSRKNRMCHHLTPHVTIFSTTFPHTKVPPRCAWVAHHCPWYDMQVASATRCPTSCILVGSVKRNCKIFRWLVLVGLSWKLITICWLFVYRGMTCWHAT